MNKPYTIRMFIPNGNPSSLKIIDKMNWTGVGLEISRPSWNEYRNREELNRAGVYILVGYQEGDDLPTLYIGQGDGIRNRIDSHEKNKPFWDKALIFVSSNHGLNRAHITWLEWALITKAQLANRCKIDNSVTPSEPVLSQSEKADTLEFLHEILSILPLLEVKIFEKSEKIIAAPPTSTSSENLLNTIIVPAQQDGFKEVFIKENCWYAIRIGGGRLRGIKYIAAYQVAPTSAITHYAEVASIEPYGDGGKYKLNFAAPARPITPIPFGQAKSGSMQSPRYTNIDKLLSAKTVAEMFE
ncbi:GIY-YIG nuclease family protein [Cellvibrio sp.]|uniref:GIY-YIG nuclease family protein n=1 Tax=Cellvibrio sp. TaxID=1965322 RepID=UPI0039647CBE